MANDLPKPCKECAFSRTSTPGELGGSRAEVYIGQTHGPFFIPCHLTYTSNDENLRRNLDCTGGCAGSAVFRANLGLDVFMPKGINRLPADHKAVFSSAAEFLAHHKSITLEQAKQQLIDEPAEKLLLDELNDPRMRLLNEKRKPV